MPPPDFYFFLLTLLRPARHQSIPTTMYGIMNIRSEINALDMLTTSQINNRTTSKLHIAENHFKAVKQFKTLSHTVI